MSLGFGFSLPAATWNGGSALSSDPSLYMDYTVGSSGVPGVQPGYYLVDDVSGNLTQTTFSSLITFSRASNATRFSPTGQLEYAPHNLLLQSQDFATTWSWTRGSTTANTSVAPDGTLTGDKLVPNTDNNSHRVVQTVTTSAGTWTFSAYLKKGEYSGAEFRIADGTSTVTNSGTRTTVDLLTGSLSSTSFYGPNATAGSASIVDAGNDWYRVSVTVTVTSSAGSLQGQIFVQSVAGTTTYAGDGTSGIYIWGAQLAVGPNALDYTPTTTAVVYGPRFDYNPSTLVAQGLLIEEQRTNSIRNNTMVGAVAGTPGTLPTNWIFSVATTTGLTTEVVGTGTESGITYVDLKVSGTAVGAGSLTIAFELNAQTVAVQNQVWTVSMYRRLMAGSFNGLTSATANIFLNSYTAIGTFAAASTSQIRSESIPTSAALNTQRSTLTGTLSSAATERVNAGMFFTIANGAVIDITLRIGLPQLEQGAFATSVIPTTTAATTRSADIASIGTLSPWYNATEGTLFAEWSSVGSLSDSRIVYALSDGTFNNVNYLTAATAAAANQSVNTIRSSNTAQATIAVPGAYTNYTDRKTAAVYKVNDFAISGDGSAVAVDTSGLLPVGVDRLALGTSWIATSNFLSGYLRRITYTPRRLTNAELQSLTS